MSRYGKEVPFNELLNKVLTSVEMDKHNERIVFTTNTGETFQMLHHQDCCEGVSVEDIVGDLANLIGYPILIAEERTREKEESKDDYGDVGMWTFYEIATVKGSVTIRWYGSSNGYYSVSVNFEKVNENETF